MTAGLRAQWGVTLLTALLPLLEAGGATDSDYSPVFAIDTRPPLPPPAVTHHFPTHQSVGADPATEIRVTFNIPVTGVSASSFEVALTNHGGTVLPGTVSTSDNRTFALTPSQTLPLGAEVRLTLRAAGIQGEGNQLPLAGDIAFTFKVFPDFQIRPVQVLDYDFQPFLTHKDCTVRVFVDDFGGFPHTVTGHLKVDGVPIPPPTTGFQPRNTYSLEDEKAGRDSLNFHHVRFTTPGSRTLEVTLQPEDPALLNTYPWTTFPTKIAYVQTADPTRPFRLKLVPLEAGDWHTSAAVRDAGYVERASAQVRFVKAIFPVNDQTFHAQISEKLVLEIWLYNLFSLRTYFFPIAESTKHSQYVIMLDGWAKANPAVDKYVGVTSGGVLAGDGLALQDKGWIGLGKNRGSINYDAVLIEVQPHAVADYHVLAHELTHTLTRRYDGGSPNLEEYSRYPPKGRLADNGWWTALGANGRRANLRNVPTGDRADLVGPAYISYMTGTPVNGTWILESDHNLLHSLFVSPPAGARIPRSGDPTTRMLLQGAIAQDGQTALECNVSGPTVDPEPPPVEDPDGFADFYQGSTLLRSLGFHTLHLSNETAVADFFLLVAEVPTATDRIDLRSPAGAVLGSHPFSAHAPTVTLTAPTGGVLGDAATVSWTAQDQDPGDILLTTLYYSRDNGTQWELIAAAQSGNSYTWDTTGFAGSSDGRLKIIVSDGFRTAEDQSSSPFTIPTKPPRAIITEPADGAYVGSGTPVLFTAYVQDPQSDQPVPQSSMQWTSSLDGPLGSGDAFSTANLSLGAHTVGLTVIRATGLPTTADPITIHVQTNEPPTVVATIPPAGVVGQPVDFSAQGFDEDGNISLYQWDFDDNGTPDWSSSATGATTHAYTQTGRYTAVSYVQDNNGSVASNPGSILITAPRTLSGHITHNGAGLAGVEVRLYGTASLVTTTDVHGAYSFSGLAAAQWLLQADTSTYPLEPATQSILLGEDVLDADFAVAVPFVVYLDPDAADRMILSWEGNPNRHYRIEHASPLSGSLWAPVPGAYTLPGSSATMTFTLTADASRFFRVLAQAQPFDTSQVLLFADDFNDGVLDPYRWTPRTASGLGHPEGEGHSVVEAEGVLTLSMDQAGAGGAVWSVPIWIDRTLPVRITRRVRAHAGPQFAAATLLLDPGFLEWTRVAVRYYYQFNNQDAFALGAGTDPAHLLPSTWDAWFDEEIIYHPTTGQTTYTVNGTSTVQRMETALLGDRLRLSFDAYGWWTGHRVDLDEVRVEQFVSP